jgi:hypothetical protein
MQNMEELKPLGCQIRHGVQVPVLSWHYIRRMEANDELSAEILSIVRRKGAEASFSADPHFFAKFVSAGFPDFVVQRFGPEVVAGYIGPDEKLPASPFRFLITNGTLQFVGVGQIESVQQGLKAAARRALAFRLAWQAY